MQINDGRVIPNFMWQALRGENLTVYGVGSQTRSFWYVSDEVDGILRLARSAEHEPVNVGNPTEFTILECARKVIATTGSASQIKFEALPQDDPKQRCPDISKAKRVLGWEPKVELESGLKLSLEYFRRAVAKKEQLRNPQRLKPDSTPCGYVSAVSVVPPKINCGLELFSDAVRPSTDRWRGLRAGAEFLRARRNRET